MDRMKQEIEQLNYRVKELGSKLIVLLKLEERDLIFLSIDDEIEQLSQNHGKFKGLLNIDIDKNQDEMYKHEYDSVMEMKTGDNPQTSFILCIICNQEKAKSAFTFTQRKIRDRSNRKCKSCLQKLKLSPNYI